jgi:ribosomal protein S18 acetylase RimI-like enzyme
MPIIYALEPKLSAQDFQNVLIASTLAERRPANDLGRLDKMLRNADVIVTAREDNRLVGVSRAITDFSFCCYLSDLAVDAIYQGQGIGKKLIEETHKAAGLRTNLFLVSAPAAEGYYAKIGMKTYPCFGSPRSE